MSEEELCEQTTAAYEDADRRLGDCDRCPETGGACHGEQSVLAPGMQPVWIDGKLSLTEPCDRWREYALGQWLRASGVPLVACHHRLGTFPVTETQHDVGALYQGWMDGTITWALLEGPRNSGRTHLSVGLLRGLKISRARWALAYENGRQLRTSMRRYFDDRERTPYPLERFVFADFAVLENLDPARYPDWLIDAIDEALQERWENQKPTLITTTSVDAIADRFESIDLAGVPVCRLAR